MDAFVARQPIFDGRREVFGYELLHRSGPQNFCGFNDADAATSTVISDSLFIHGFEELTGGRRGFINITRNLLLQDVITALPCDRTVVELLETIAPDPEVIEACRRVRKAGYLVAMDDFVFDPAFMPLVHEVDIVKVDFTRTSPRQREEFAELEGTDNLRLLAEKVETHQDFDEALALGYELFQGYFFCKPQIVRGRDIPVSKLGYLRFLHQVNEPEIDFDRLEEIVRAEVSLSYKLLKHLNSSFFGLRSKVTSIRQALALLGERSLKQWASLMAIANLGSGKPHELILTCLIRARFCELLGQATGRGEQAHQLFLTGLLSTLDALLDRPMEDVLRRTGLDEQVEQTLLGRETTISGIYALARAYERGQWQDVARISGEIGAEGEQITRAYRGAIEWAEKIERQGERGASALAG